MSEAIDLRVNKLEWIAEEARETSKRIETKLDALKEDNHSLKIDFVKLRTQIFTFAALLSLVITGAAAFIKLYHG